MPLLLEIKANGCGLSHSKSESVTENSRTALVFATMSMVANLLLYQEKM